MLLVEDNSLDFDLDHHRAELFHLFRRCHDHTEGTGVGLYRVNRIVQNNGGRVEVESEVGVGSSSGCICRPVVPVARPLPHALALRQDARTTTANS